MPGLVRDDEVDGNLLAFSFPPRNRRQNAIKETFPYEVTPVRKVFWKRSNLEFLEVGMVVTAL